jgi:hypothetical protein
MRRRGNAWFALCDDNLLAPLSAKATPKEGLLLRLLLP